MNEVDERQRSNLGRWKVPEGLSSTLNDTTFSLPFRIECGRADAVRPEIDVGVSQSSRKKSNVV